MPFKKGDILQGKNRQKNAARHYILYFAQIDGSSFAGGMITTAGNYKNNILMNKNHFEEVDSDGTQYKIQYKNSHLVQRKFLKLENWGPFKCVGKLTTIGVSFAEEHTPGSRIGTWEDYLKETNFVL
jgi:hypothetical protein